jgi:hypothetical protein
LRRLDVALHVLRDIYLFLIVLALFHQDSQLLSGLFQFLLELIILLSYEIITYFYNNILIAMW